MSLYLLLFTLRSFELLVIWIPLESFSQGEYDALFYVYYLEQTTRKEKIAGERVREHARVIIVWAIAVDDYTDAKRLSAYHKGVERDCCAASVFVRREVQVYTNMLIQWFCM